jgi:hypothetical protein
MKLRQLFGTLMSLAVLVGLTASTELPALAKQPGQLVAANDSDDFQIPSKSEARKSKKKKKSKKHASKKSSKKHRTASRKKSKHNRKTASTHKKSKKKKKKHHNSNY